MVFECNNFIEGEGEPLIFQHGLAANVNQIVGLLGSLEGIQLSGIDCPGHGKSILKNFNFSFDNYADQVIRFMDYREIERVIIGGLSMGSGIALNISLRYPKRVKALILHRPAWLDAFNPPNLMILREASPLIGRVGGQQKFKLADSYLNIATKLPSAAKSVLGIFSDEQQSVLARVIDDLVADRPFDNIESLTKIRVPCLIIGNDDDPLHPLDMAVTIHKKIRGSIFKKVTSRYIDGELHRKQVRENILNFIKRL